MNSKDRISAIKQTPLTWKELDIITAAEKYMKGEIQFPMVDFALPCFPGIAPKVIQKIKQVWQYGIAAFHLQKQSKQQKNTATQKLLVKASRIYEQETQRILGSIFPLEHPFWKSFYQRQETDLKKPLVAIDALHFYTKRQEKIAYQLLTQSLKAILKGQYETQSQKNKYYENADRLLMDLPVEAFKTWLQNQKSI